MEKEREREQAKQVDASVDDGQPLVNLVGRFFVSDRTGRRVRRCVKNRHKASSSWPESSPFSSDDHAT